MYNYGVSNKKYSIEEFIELTKKNPDEWNHYCEIIIDNDGQVILARPSHQICLLQYYCDKENIKMEDAEEYIPREFSPEHFIIDKYNLISVWYESILSSYRGPNEAQLKSLELLKENKLIIPEYLMDKTNEYHLYLYRKNNGLLMDEVKIPEGFVETKNELPALGEHIMILSKNGETYKAMRTISSFYDCGYCYKDSDCIDHLAEDIIAWKKCDTGGLL